MKIIADTHTHTLASTHAYSTLLENASAASQIGLKYMAVTDHAPAMPDAPHLWHFLNLRLLPFEINGVRILRGVEANIIDKDGNIDLDDEVLSSLEWVVASFHIPAVKKTLSIDEVTSAYIAVANNPYIDVIGHSGTYEFGYDYEKVIPIFAENNKLVEINENSFTVRGESKRNCMKIAKLCKLLGAKVIVNSDAHFAYSIGKVERTMDFLKRIDFPEELIVNSSVKRFEEYLASRSACKANILHNI